MPTTDDNKTAGLSGRLWIVPLIVAALAVPTFGDWWPRVASRLRSVRQVSHEEYIPVPGSGTVPQVTTGPQETIVVQGQPTTDVIHTTAANCGCENHKYLLGVQCADGCCGELGWGAARPLDFQPFMQGEYVGHARTAHVPEYRLRVDDVLEFVFRLTREETSHPYLLNVGDEVRVESFTDPTLNRDLLIQPDGTITLRLVGQVKATRRTVEQLREEIDKIYSKYYKIPAITVTPLKVNTKLEDLRATVDARAGAGGQNCQARVTPEGTIALPAVGNVPVQGLTLEELKRELNLRFAAEVEGIEVTPVLLTRAPRYAYVLGEVRTPGRYVLEGPTTVMQTLSMAGGWNVGANTRQIVVFRRGDDWRLLATMLDLRGALYGKMPCPADEIWVNDADIIVVPKSPILVADDFINLVFTRGIYGIAPYSVSTSFSFFNQLNPSMR